MLNWPKNYWEKKWKKLLCLIGGRLSSLAEHQLLKKPIGRTCPLIKTPKLSKKTVNLLYRIFARKKRSQAKQLLHSAHTANTSNSGTFEHWLFIVEGWRFHERMIKELTASVSAWNNFYSSLPKKNVHLHSPLAEIMTRVRWSYIIIKEGGGKCRWTLKPRNEDNFPSLKTPK